MLGTKTNPLCIKKVLGKRVEDGVATGETGLIPENYLAFLEHREVAEWTEEAEDEEDEENEQAYQKGNEGSYSVTNHHDGATEEEASTPKPDDDVDDGGGDGKPQVQWEATKEAEKLGEELSPEESAVALGEPPSKTDN